LVDEPLSKAMVMQEDEAERMRKVIIDERGGTV